MGRFLPFFGLSVRHDLWLLQRDDMNDMIFEESACETLTLHAIAEEARDRLRKPALIPLEFCPSLVPSFGVSRKIRKGNGEP